MKTFLEICQYIGNSPNSELSEDITSLGELDSEQLNAINKALGEIFFLAPWEFRGTKSDITTVIGQAEYPMVNGVIKENGVKLDGKLLTYEQDFEFLDPASGAPTKYYKEGEDLVIYPTPVATGTLRVKYRNDKPVKAVDSTEKDFLEVSSDVLNIPQRLERLFLDFLAHRTNEILNADQTDEEYLEHQYRGVKAYQMLKEADKGTEDKEIGFMI